MLKIASLTVSISKLRHYTNFSDRPTLSQYPGSTPTNHIVSVCIVTKESLQWVHYLKFIRKMIVTER